MTEEDYTDMVSHVFIQFLATEGVLDYYLDALLRTIESGRKDDDAHVDRIRHDLRSAMLYISWGNNRDEFNSEMDRLSRRRWEVVDTKWRDIYQELHNKYVDDVYQTYHEDATSGLFS